MSRADTSDPEIKAAIDDLKSGGTNWLLLGYVPKSDTKIRVADKGTGGFKELAQEFNDGKVLFGLCSFDINNTKKFVYIAWCGEGVIGMKKGLFNNHSQDVQAVFKGYHVQINARHEDDLDEAKIMAKLKTSSGASYDSGAKNQGTATHVPTNVAQGRQQAAVSNAKVKTADKSDYNKKDESSDFWTRQKEEEERNKNNAAKGPAKTDYAKTAERDQFWANQNAEKEQEQQRAAANNNNRPAASGGASALRNKFENPQPSQPPPRQAPPPARPPAAAPPKAAPAPPPVHVPEPEPEPVYEQQQEEQQWQEEQPQEQQQEEWQQEEQQPQEQQQEEQQQQYDEEPQQQQEEQQWQQEEQPQEQQWQQEEQPADTASYDQQQTYDDQSYQQDDQAAAGGGYVGTAQALYDYEGENPDDLGFKEGDVINVIDKSDPSGWWEGEINGVRGFFPSNFVQEI